MFRINLSEHEIRKYYEAHLPKLKKSGKELRGPCPLHAGVRSSFAINLETGQWFCHSTCNRGGSIFDFEAEYTGADAKTARAVVLNIVGRSPEPERRIVATYDYVDENGVLLYQTVRYEPKDFKQRRPDGNGGWTWNLKGVRLVLYRLPVILAAPIVFVCEGEKDADALIELGVTATTSPLGAGKWHLEYSQSLRGKAVYVIPDADEKGRNHAADVMKSLSGVAASSKRIELPDGAKDAAAWIASGGTVEQLVELAEREDAAPPREAVTPATDLRPPSSSGLAEFGAKLVEDTEKFIRRYMVMPEAAYLPLTLWAPATHVAEEFDCFPYIAAVSPMKRSGKTRLSETLELLARRPWRGTAPSPAALYRMLEDAPTLLLDEIEALNGKNKSETSLILLAVLNAGHRKGATIPRCDGPHHEVRHFPVYGPKLFAAIGKLPDTLSDRSIVVKMKRRTKAQPVARFRLAKAGAEAKPLRDAAEHFAEIARGDIRRAYQQIVETDLTFLNDRDADIWSPLFAICRVAAPDRWGELEKWARDLSTAKAGDDADDSWKLTLLRDIRAEWPDGEDKFETSKLLAKLNILEESPWKDHPLTSRKLAGMLRPFEVEPRTIRIDDERTAKGYCYEQLKDAFDRYLEK